VSFVVKISSFCRGLLCYNFWDDVLICAYQRSSVSNHFGFVALRALRGETLYDFDVNFFMSFMFFMVNSFLSLQTCG